MSTPAFTPGPWEQRSPRSTTVLHYAVRVREGFPAMTVPYEISYAKSAPGGEPARIANARLIAAAPELYEAVEDLAERMIGAFPSLADTPEIQRAKAALAKARGEA